MSDLLNKVLDKLLPPIAGERETAAWPGVRSPTVPAWTKRLLPSEMPDLHYRPTPAQRQHARDLVNADTFMRNQAALHNVATDFVPIQANATPLQRAINLAVLRDEAERSGKTFRPPEPPVKIPAGNVDTNYLNAIAGDEQAAKAAIPPMAAPPSGPPNSEEQLARDLIARSVELQKRKDARQAPDSSREPKAQQEAQGQIPWTTPYREDLRRLDGNVKGPGFAGTVKHKSGANMTELSVGLPGTEEGFYPLLGPWLSAGEITRLHKGLAATPAMYDKARKAAKERAAKGEPIFAPPGYSAGPRIK